MILQEKEKWRGSKITSKCMCKREKKEKKWSGESEKDEMEMEKRVVERYEEKDVFLEQLFANVYTIHCIQYVISA